MDQILLVFLGKFLMKFGDKGSEPGNFNYPWDVACNSHVSVFRSRGVYCMSRKPCHFLYSEYKNRTRLLGNIVCTRYRIDRTNIRPFYIRYPSRQLDTSGIRQVFFYFDRLSDARRSSKAGYLANLTSGREGRGPPQHKILYVLISDKDT